MVEQPRPTEGAYERRGNKKTKNKLCCRKNDDGTFSCIIFTHLEMDIFSFEFSHPLQWLRFAGARCAEAIQCRTTWDITHLIRGKAIVSEPRPTHIQYPILLHFSPFANINALKRGEHSFRDSFAYSARHGRAAVIVSFLSPQFVFIKWSQVGLMSRATPRIVCNETENTK